MKIKVGDYDMTLNEQFLIKNNALNNVEEIKRLFTKKFKLFMKMKKEEDSTKLKKLANKVLENEYLIQEAFNFKRSEDHFRFWEMPKCACPVMDNMDMWGTSMHYYSANCPYHGR